MKVLLTGNEAIARGAYEFGVAVAAAYPGTPSTEILENIAQYREIKSQWSPNEKVAMEVAVGASIAGARTLAAMKHVGVNVAADPLFTLSYSGVNGGLVLVSADDPGMHSSQNEQDNRYYAKFAKIPMFEPSDSQEAKDFVGLSLDVSEAYDVPVLLRSTTRISHSKTLVELNAASERLVKSYVKDIKKNVMIPGHARLKRLHLEERYKKLQEYSETTPVNRVEWADKKVGVITSGIAYQYVKEAMPDASILKLGFTWPLPDKMILDFASRVETLYVIEENEPYLEEHIKALGVVATGKDIFPITGELSARIIERAIGGETHLPGQLAENVPMRPPVLCPGCPHRAVFYVLKQLKLHVTGDIGCYTLGALSPLDSMDTTICMGASIPMALGFEKAHPELAEKTVAVIGDSTFIHSGITGLIDIVYNHGTSTVLILDNSTTAMTGHQENPSTGKTLQKDPTTQVDMEALCRAVGVKRVFTVDPFAMDELKELIKREVATREPSVIIAKRPCALIVKHEAPLLTILHDNCVGCKMCMRVGCPAISHGNKKSTINAALCIGCGVCAQVCKFSAIVGDIPLTPIS
ncbi:MAG: indolepyruvate ferredoxin oxidoreductase alpha subunit [Bacillota bacterium]|nr:MAG: indolepyruvate ferredoxin oxidoreductase alpha subunit [Bacillota bacterium]MBS3950868.1 indolepyruvate ferredoxin oxidoreductase subunit alpha [Peptococcaceae bacterium]